MGRQLVDLDAASDDARYVARLHEAAQDAVRTRLTGIVNSGVARRKMARDSRISVGTLNNFLAGRSDVGLGTLVALALGLGMSSLDELLVEPALTGLAHRINDEIAGTEVRAS